MKTTQQFILVEAAARIPLVRRILRDTRELRSRSRRLDRQIRESAGDGRRRRLLMEQLAHVDSETDRCLAEANELGIFITPGVRCEAWFPFAHRWVGEQGDGKVRQAYFVYTDAKTSITHWFFRGHPSDRRRVWPGWWTVRRSA